MVWDSEVSDSDGVARESREREGGADETLMVGPRMRLNSLVHLVSMKMSFKCLTSWARRFALFSPLSISQANTRPLPPSFQKEGFAGQDSSNLKLYDLTERRTIDSDLVSKAISFMRRNFSTSTPFFLYHPMVHLHFPTLPHPDFEGRSGNGNFANSMMEMDYRVGQIVDEVEKLGIKENTVFIFASE